LRGGASTIDEWPFLLSKWERVTVDIEWQLSALGQQNAGGVDAPVALLGPSASSPFLLAGEVWRGCNQSPDGAVVRMSQGSMAARHGSTKVTVEVDLSRVNPKVNYITVSLVAPGQSRSYPLNRILDWLKVTINQGGATRVIELCPIPHADSDTASQICTFFRPHTVPGCGLPMDPSSWAVDRSVIGMDTNGEAQPLRCMEQIMPAMHHWLQSKATSTSAMTTHSHYDDRGLGQQYGQEYGLTPAPYDPNAGALTTIDGVMVSQL
jgi:hypothetical protein